ncbi:MAG: MarR family transcriptional regulator [Actinomycetota bacterium]|jgi:DNA-binding MarR family transcriptional regulator|nr:MarR family transcriptional regulator [Actinomycetota bacterium]
MVGSTPQASDTVPTPVVIPTRGDTGALDGGDTQGVEGVRDVRGVDCTKAPTGDPLEEVARLRTALVRVVRRLQSVDVAAGAGFTPTELSLLGAVVRRGPVRSSDLAACEGLHPTMASRLVARLAERGLVCRDPAACDGRSTLVSATAEGHERFAQLRAQRAASLAAALQRLPLGERRALEAALPALEALGDELASSSW